MVLCIKNKVNIWNPSLCYDDLINYYFSNNIIVISDYNGIYLYNNKLELKFNNIIGINDRFKDIYGFKVEKNGNNELICIKYWSMHDAPSQYLINSELQIIMILMNLKFLNIILLKKLIILSK